jgi:uncharacterized iron-regulated protein
LKNRLIGFAVFLIWTIGACGSAAQRPRLRLYDFNSGRTLAGPQALEQLRQARIILVGEHHNVAAHHEAQLAILRSLHQAGRKVAVGLEMFRRNSQPELDRWVAGRIPEDDFKPIYLDNWNYDWSLYRPIFVYARDKRIPMVGLNVPSGVTSQVAYHGFASLSADQKGSLEGITCDVTEQYRQFIRRAHGAHGHGGMAFERFCEAQLVWDTAMAVHVLEFLADHPDYTMVILTGSGHARKMGIPAQLAKRGAIPCLVVLPETAGIFEPDTLSPADTDLLFLKP